jgi:hypothetical protein
MDTMLNLDFLGIKPVFNISGHKSSKSLFGAILSIIISLLLMLGSGYFLNLLFSRSNYTVIQADNFNTTQSMNWTNYEFAIHLLDRIGEPIKEADRVFDIVGTHYFYKKVINSDGTVTAKMSYANFPLEKCNVSKHFQDNIELWKEEKYITDSMCLPRDVPFNISLPYGATGFSQMKFWIYRCVNTTLKNNCLSKSQIEATLNNVNPLLRFKNYYFDHTNLDQPGISYVHTETSPASSTVNRRMGFGFRNVDYKTDDGFFLPENRVQSYSVLYEVKESTDLKEETTVPGAFLSFSFYMNNLKLSYSRKYYKFQNMLADLGGLAKAALSISYFINWYFCNKLYYQQIINHNINNFIELDMNSQINNLNNYTSQPPISRRNLNNSSQMINVPPIEKVSNIDFRNNFVRVDVIRKAPYLKIINSEKFKKQILKINNIGLLFPISCFGKSSNIRKQLYTFNRFKNFINDQMDILNIIAKMNIIDKINFLLTGENNMYVLQNCFNPLINKKEIPINGEIVKVQSLIAERLKELFDNTSTVSHNEIA